jgi:hypothetical protein
MDLAACKGTELSMWFPSRPAQEPLSICEDCPVKSDCLSYALEHKAVGIWGGRFFVTNPWAQEQKRKKREARSI